MRRAVVTIEGVSPLAISRYNKNREAEDAQPDFYEISIWKDSTSSKDEGFIFLPPMAFKSSLDAAAELLDEKEQNEYAPLFKHGIEVLEPLGIRFKEGDIQEKKVYFPGCHTKYHPQHLWDYFHWINLWGGEVTYRILDRRITKMVFRRHIKACGEFIGLGFFRPQHGSLWGQFEVTKIKWRR